MLSGLKYKNCKIFVSEKKNIYLCCEMKIFDFQIVTNSES